MIDYQSFGSFKLPNVHRMQLLPIMCLCRDSFLSQRVSQKISLVVGLTRFKSHISFYLFLFLFLC